ncbi:MAG: NAD-dependent epimerase/dehydratase family protein [Pseudomonadota bacterium]
MQILVTGAAGFIGADLTQKLLAAGHHVVGVDNMNDYYEVSLKQARLAEISRSENHGNFNFLHQDICERESCAQLFHDFAFDAVVNLAAQAGVRYSLENPQSYIDSNLVGFGNILEGCRHANVQHLIYASSSSVYGANRNFPFSEADRVDNPVSMYAATKKANELMAHSYAHLYGMRCTGLRFFTVYGPWGRPDMAPVRFASRMLKGEPIPVYNEGNMIRDFTYIDDISDGMMKVIAAKQGENYRVYNIGRGEPVQLLDFIKSLETHLGVTAVLNMLPMQDGDVPRTMADTARLESDFGYRPTVSMDDGVKRFADWYRSYYS